MSEHTMSMAEFLGADICSNKHSGSLESKDAFSAVRGSINAMHEEILTAIDKFGPMSAKELSQVLGKALHSVSGRCTELKALCYLEKTGERRDGSAVLRRTGKQWNGRVSFLKAAI
jgi:predicted HTH transcriptional regulator